MIQKLIKILFSKNNRKIIEKNILYRNDAEELLNDEFDFTECELLEYDKHVEFFYTNIINSLILFSYSSEELRKMEYILIDPLTELYEELDYAFTPVLFETVFRNNKINNNIKDNLLKFKKMVDDIPNEIWDYNFIGVNNEWKDVQLLAEHLLNRMDVKSKTFNTKFHNIHFKH